MMKSKMPGRGATVRRLPAKTVRRKDGDTATVYAKGGWMSDIKKGGLHKSLGIAADKKIPAAKIAKAAKQSGKVGKQARLAQTFAKMRKK